MGGPGEGGIIPTSSTRPARQAAAPSPRPRPNRLRGSRLRSNGKRPGETSPPRTRGSTGELGYDGPAGAVKTREEIMGAKPRKEAAKDPDVPTVQLSALNEAWLHVKRHQQGTKRLTKEEQDLLLEPEVDLRTGKLLHDPGRAKAALAKKSPPRKP